MRAAPGSGKSTWIKTNLQDPVVCSADHYFYNTDGVYTFNKDDIGRAHNHCKNAFQKALGESRDLIVVDNTNIKKKNYSFYVGLGKQHGYTVYQKCLTTSFGSIHNVPEETVQRMKLQFEADETLPEY